SMADPKLSKAVISLAFHPSGEFLAASYDIPAVEGFEQPIVLWDTSTGLRVDPPFVGHRFEVTSLAFAPDGKHLVSGSWDNDVRLWATDTRQIIPPILVEAARGEAELWERRGPTGVAVSPDGKTLVSVMSNELAMWDIASHKVLWRLSGIINATTLALSRNGKLAGIGGESKNFVLISTDFKHWLRAACQLAPRRLTVAETRYYLGESADRHMATEDPCLEFVDN
ncbi:MAG: WD40 repeat domain-containing protein, partial [Kiloniellales bacterium]